MMMLAVCMMAMAQMKLTPKAQLQVVKQKSKVECKAAKARARGKVYVPTVKEQHMTLVVKVAQEGAAETFAQLKAKGAKVLSKLGHQAVVSVPVDSIDAMSHLDGVLRIDVGHKGRLKTDVTMKETGISKIDGTQPNAPYSYTGKGVTVCVIDMGFDFQHPAFKDAEGRSRIKCVYMIGDEGGRKFTVEDEEAGTIEFPGTVYDTPELLAQLTTDSSASEHGTHTSGIAAGSRSPLGFGGMAPDADIVIIPLGHLDEPGSGGDNDDDGDGDDEGDGDEEMDTNDLIEMAINFAATYAKMNEKPTVLSVSMNSHDGIHDGTGTVPEAIAEASNWLIPVFSAGNEGMNDIHASHTFGTDDNVLRLLLPNFNGENAGGDGDDDDDDDDYNLQSLKGDDGGEDGEGDEKAEANTETGVIGVSRLSMNGKEKASIEVVLIDKETGENLWSSTPLDLSADGEGVDILACTSEFDDKLAAYYQGTVSMGGTMEPSGKMHIEVMIKGNLDESNHIFSFVMTSTDNMAFDFWERAEEGFVAPQLEGFTKGDNLMSAGDWSSTASAVSVGAYANNAETRSYSGIVSENEDMLNLLIILGNGVGGIAPFSSFGEQSDGYCQPTVCAPGTNIVSSWNHYNCDAEIIESMQWQGYPYGAGSGTSQACPTVSGIIACWLQAKPDMTLNDVKTLLSHTSRTDEFVSSDPLKWGYGKIDAAAGIEYILSQTDGIRTISDTPATHAIYDLQGRRVKQPVRGLYIQNGYKVVIK